MLLVVIIGCTGSNGETSQDVQSDSTGDTQDIIICPDGLILTEEYNVCAPEVDECEAWEVPVVGGGCMAVGPRACPKLWDPAADVDCEPGALMDYEGNPCPEGFVLTEDEVACIPFFEEDGVCGELEIPVLGGGCQRVGPEWAVPGQPLFDECGDGLLALPGGGCVMIGPRGCPKVWDPDADVDCEVGDVLPCPEGWMESYDGMYCHPGWDECPHGEVPVTGGGCKRLLPVAEDCPPGPFSEVPNGATDVLHVLVDSSCTEGCGTAAAPYPSIQAAIDAAPADAAILVGPGTYDESLTLDKPVHVSGLCSALVEVSGKGLVLPDGDSKVLEAGVGIVDVQGVTLSGLRVRSPAAGIAVVGATGVAFEALEVTESHGVALYLDGGSEVKAADLWIHDTTTGSGTMGRGRGVWVGGGANLEAQSVLVDEVRWIGIEVRGEGARLHMSSGVVRSTNPDGSGLGGWGMAAVEGCKFEVTGSILDENKELGLSVHDFGTEVEVSSSVIRRSLPNELGQGGWGIRAADGCKVSMAGSLLEENNEISFGVYDSGTEVQATGNVIRGTLPGKDGEVGFGFCAESGCKVLLSGGLLEENGGIGLAVVHSGTEVEATGNVIRKTLPGNSGECGWGNYAAEGCRVLVEYSLLEENVGAGLVVLQSGTEFEVSNSVVRNTMPNENGSGGYGLQAGEGSAVSMAGSLMEENRVAGFAAFDSGTTADMSGSVIRRTRTNENGEDCQGVHAAGGCAISVTSSVLEDNMEFGLAVLDSGTTVEVSDSVIRRTTPDENGEFGRGIGAFLGCSTSVVGCLLEENRSAGLVVFDSGTEVELSGSVVRKTMPDEHGGVGWGIQAAEGSTVSVDGSLLEENSTIGLAVFHSGTEVEVSRSVVRKTMPDDNGEEGWGIQASDGCTVSVAGSLMEENRVAGFAAFDSGTTVEVAGSVVRKMIQNTGGQTAYGIQAGKGCTALVAGSLLEENKGVGLVAFHPGTACEVFGSVIRTTLLDNEEQHGQGMVLDEGASGLVSWCRVDGNYTTGVTVSGRAGDSTLGPSLLRMHDSAVLSTREGGAVTTMGGFEVFGDGVTSIGGSELVLDSVVVQENARTGIFYFESSGVVTGSMITGNGSYGVAMQESDQLVDLSDSYIFGNALEAVTTKPSGLPVPPPPEFLEAYSSRR